MHYAQASVTRTGDYALVKFEYEYDFQYGNCSKPVAEREPNKILNYLQVTTAPARLAGQILLVHETVDQAKEPRSAWTYNPGQRRVRLAPNVAYDNPGTAADGLRTNDDFGMFNGATDRYNWKLVGKKEMYMPYNSYKLSDPKTKYADILKAGHINQDHARYELHRVWIVEATLKPGTSHIYAKRVFFIDEDSWGVLATDKYDGRGELWRFSEMHNENWYNVPMTLRHRRGPQRPAVRPLPRHGTAQRGSEDLRADQALGRATTTRTACAASARASDRPGDWPGRGQFRAPGGAGTAPFLLGRGK